MAFPLPDHLPRHAYAADSKQSLGSDETNPVLAKLADVSVDSLTFAQASSWVDELTGTIDDTRTRINTLVTDNLPSFERQLHTSKDIQARVKALSLETDRLTSSLNDPETGLAPTLTKRFAEHGALTQKSLDADLLARTTAHIIKCRDTLGELTSLVHDARLAETVPVSGLLAKLLDEAPEPLPSSKTLMGIKHRHRILTDQVQERIQDAYSRAVRIESNGPDTRLAIQASVPISNSPQNITLSEVLISSSSDASNQRLSTFRKDVLTKFVDVLTRTPSHVETEGAVLILKPTSSAHPIQQLSSLADFLHEHLFVHIPSQHSQRQLASYYDPLTTAVLDLLRRDMPSSHTALPQYLDSVHSAVTFEGHIAELGISAGAHRAIAEWAHGVQTHYERKRREDILEAARRLVTDERLLSGSRVQKEKVVLVKDVLSPAIAEEPTNNGEEESSWDFDDDAPLASGSSSPTVPGSPAIKEDAATEEEPAGDGWGFDEDATPSSPQDPEFASEEADPWDDGWDAEPTSPIEPPSPPPPEPEPEPAKPSTPRLAKRLEKFSAKGKHSLGALNSSASASDASLNGSPLSAVRQPLPSSRAPTPPAPVLRPPPPAVAPITVPPVPAADETYLVSECAKSILRLCLETIEESRQLRVSNIFEDAGKTGTLLLTTIPSAFDLFRALYAIAHADMMAMSSSLRIRLSNDCVYLAAEVGKIASEFAGDDEAKLLESSERLAALGESCFDDCLEQQRAEIYTVFQRAEGFVYTGDDTRFAVCKSVVENAKETIVSISQDWKVTLARSAYLEATGFLVEEALSFVLEDILALPDIPEIESHRLNELCRTLDGLKDLFIERPGLDSTVGAHVPSWFKFAYISELMEASLADITYLFESGALIDFEVEELVRLVQGLFSDTPLRRRTIEKILAGHPGQ